MVELNFFKSITVGKNTSVDPIESVPRLISFDKNMSILEVKTILRSLLKGVLELDSETDTNDAIQVYVRDNLPMVAVGKYSKKKQ